MPLPDPLTDRRPIAARNLAATISLADWLIRRKASPDAISVAGMAAAIGAGLLFAMASGHRAAWLLGALLILLRLLANMLDGMVAIGRGIASTLGEVFNEVPDRVADIAVLAGLGVAAQKPWLGLAAALAAVATAYVRVVGKAAGQPSDFSGPMAKQQRMALATLAALWCATAPARLAVPALRITLWVILVLSVLTAGRRLARLARALQAAGA